MLGRAIACAEGCRFVAGIGIDSWKKFAKDKDVDVAGESMLTLCDALVGVDPDSFCQYGGFTICLTPKQVLLTPPGIVLIEVPLSEANFSVHWHYMVPSHLRGSADERLKEQVDYAEQVTFFDLKKADDENTSLSQVTFLQKVSAELDVAQSLLLWLSKLAKARYTVRGLVGLEFDFVWPFDEFQGDLDALVQEAVDKKCKLGKRIGRIHEELVKAEKDSKREVRCTDVKSFHRLSAVDQDPLLKILQPSIKFEEVDRLDEVDTVPTSILVNDALDILSAFMQRCADHKASEKKEDTKKSKESQQQQQQQPQQQNQATSELTPAQLLQPGVPSVKAIQPADAAASTGDVAENKNLNCAGKTDGANASGKQQTEPAEEETHDHEDEHTSAKQQQQQQQQQLEQAQTQGQPKPQEAPSPPAAAAELPEAQQQEKTASPPGPELQKKQPENPAPEDTTEENRNPEPVETLEMALEALMDEHDETDALEAEGESQAQEEAPEKTQEEEAKSSKSETKTGTGEEAAAPKAVAHSSVAAVPPTTPHTPHPPPPHGTAQTQTEGGGARPEPAEAEPEKGAAAAAATAKAATTTEETKTSAAAGFSAPTPPLPPTPTSQAKAAPVPVPAPAAARPAAAAEDSEDNDKKSQSQSESQSDASKGKAASAPAAPPAAATKTKPRPRQPVGDGEEAEPPPAPALAPTPAAPAPLQEAAAAADDALQVIRQQMNAMPATSSELPSAAAAAVQIKVEPGTGLDPEQTATASASRTTASAGPRQQASVSVANMLGAAMVPKAIVLAEPEPKPKSQPKQAANPRPGSKAYYTQQLEAAGVKVAASWTVAVMKEKLAELKPAQDQDADADNAKKKKAAQGDDKEKHFQRGEGQHYCKWITKTKTKHANY